ncbi:hypothetical protein [Streptomyces chattanoogensis]
MAIKIGAPRCIARVRELLPGFAASAAVIAIGSRKAVALGWSLG